MERFNPFNYPICFTKPLYLTDVEFWQGHIPFVMTIIDLVKPARFVELGSHKGDSYCAFCQAVVATKTSTQCFAIDSWEGDEHVGKYESSIYSELKNYHDPLYSSFSTLIRSYFDDALNQFEDGSIDLLHIDGLHTYEAVKHDFETWLPKLSKRGVVLFHDIYANSPYFQQRGYAVWKFWEEIINKYPNFEFKHSYGLGVLAVGEEIPEALLPLLNSKGEEAEMIRTFYHSLGHLLDTKSNNNPFALADLQNRFNESQRDRAEVRAYLSKVEQERSELNQYIKDLEKGRVELLDYVEKLEKEYANLQASNEAKAQALTNLQSSRIMRLGNRLGSLKNQVIPRK